LLLPLLWRLDPREELLEDDDLEPDLLPLLELFITFSIDVKN
jgi:hypothetical protein